jgi:hypothetical protein
MPAGFDLSQLEIPRRNQEKVRDLALELGDDRAVFGDFWALRSVGPPSNLARLACASRYSSRVSERGFNRREPPSLAAASGIAPSLLSNDIRNWSDVTAGLAAAGREGERRSIHRRPTAPRSTHGSKPRPR